MGVSETLSLEDRGSVQAYSLPSLLLADCTSSWSFLRVVCTESGFLPSVSPLACLEAAMLKGWAAKGLMRVVLREFATSARRDTVRKPDMVDGMSGLFVCLVWYCC